jgi:hypothetical protein
LHLWRDMACRRWMLVESSLAVVVGGNGLLTGDEGYDECDECEEWCDCEGEGAEYIVPFMWPGLDMPPVGADGCGTMRRFRASRMTLSTNVT